MSAFVGERISGPSVDRPTVQWEAARGAAPVTLRIFGSLGARELRRVVDAVFGSGRSPRETLCVDFEGVDHLDYRAIPDFVADLTRTRHRGPDVWLVGLSPYVRALVHVAGHGASFDRMEWLGATHEAPVARRADVGAPWENTEPIRLEAWSMAGL